MLTQAHALQREHPQGVVFQHLPQIIDGAIGIGKQPVDALCLCVQTCPQVTAQRKAGIPHQLFQRRDTQADQLGVGA